MSDRGAATAPVHDRVAAELRAARLEATATDGAGGLPVVRVEMADGSTWHFGNNPESLLWGGDYYLDGVYQDSVELKVRSDDDDAARVAAAILGRVGRPPDIE